MHIQSKLPAIFLTLAMVFSSSAFATLDAWDSATPWASATTSEFAGWNVFNGTSDFTPEVAGSGAGSIAPAGGFFALNASNNIRAVTNAAYTATLAGAGNGSGLFAVYMRTETLGPVGLLVPNLSSYTLNGVAASAVITYSLGSAFNLEQETYWLWNNVVGSALYTFQFGADRGMVLNQLSLATIAIPVPESQSGILMLVGMACIAAIARRRINSRN